MDELRKKRYYFLVLCALTFVTACANIVAPSGGPVDTRPPQFLKSEPQPGSTAFAGRKIFLKFDEFVSVKDAYTNITISPPLKDFPEFRSKGKGILITFSEPLPADRTFCIDFGNSIQDITESNIFSNYRFVFATGSHLDSLYVKGQVINAFTRQPEKDISLFLYRQSSDSLPYHTPPEFLAKSRPDGSFVFSSLPGGEFSLVAINDKNANLQYDPFVESIAFADSLVLSMPMPVADTAANDSLKPARAAVPLRNNKLFLFTERDTVQRLLKVNDKQTARFTMIFNAPVENLSYRFLKNPPATDWHLDEYAPTHDTVTCWVKEASLDSLWVEITDRGLVIDTLELKLHSVSDTATGPVIKKGGKGGGKSDSPQSFHLSMSSATGPQQAQELNQALKIQFSHPLNNPDLRGISLEEVIDSSGFPLVANFRFSDPGIQRKLNIEFAWRSLKSYRLIIPKGAFTDIYGLRNDSLVLNFSTREADSYGVLKMAIKQDSASVKAYTGSYLFQLLNDKDEILRTEQLQVPGMLTYEYMNQGDYKARIIRDANRNGRWDTGHYLHRTQPEELLYYSGQIKIKQNWDTEIDWIIQ